jgi:tripartite-type tricarboxylate transporter receptor subunit TctC
MIGAHFGARTRVARCVPPLWGASAGTRTLPIPERPTTLITPFALGGPADIIARILSVSNLARGWLPASFRCWEVSGTFAKPSAMGQEDR